MEGHFSLRTAAFLTYPVCSYTRYLYWHRMTSSRESRRSHCTSRADIYRRFRCGAENGADNLRYSCRKNRNNRRCLFWLYKLIQNWRRNGKERFDWLIHLRRHCCLLHCACSPRRTAESPWQRRPSLPLTQGMDSNICLKIPRVKLF